MITYKDALTYNKKDVKIKCDNGEVFSGKCFLYSEANDETDDFDEYFIIGSTLIFLNEIEEIEKV